MWHIDHPIIVISWMAAGNSLLEQYDHVSIFSIESNLFMNGEQNQFQMIFLWFGILLNSIQKRGYTWWKKPWRTTENENVNQTFCSLSRKLFDSKHWINNDNCVYCFFFSSSPSFSSFFFVYFLFTNRKLIVKRLRNLKNFTSILSKMSI